jgi:hypothetical protein
VCAHVCLRQSEHARSSPTDKQATPQKPPTHTEPASGRHHAALVTRLISTTNLFDLLLRAPPLCSFNAGSNEPPCCVWVECERTNPSGVSATPPCCLRDTSCGLCSLTHCLNESCRAGLGGMMASHGGVSATSAFTAAASTRDVRRQLGLPAACLALLTLQVTPSGGAAEHQCHACAARRAETEGLSSPAAAAASLMVCWQSRAHNTHAVAPGVLPAGVKLCLLIFWLQGTPPGQC